MSKSRKYFYKLGVMCGEMLYTVTKFDDFEKLAQEVKSVRDTHDDMQRCSFVIQAFKDDSYDFNKSCFFQTKTPIYRTDIDAIKGAILKEGGEQK